MQPCFQLKGSLFTLSILQLQNNDLNQLNQQLGEKIKLAPKFFQHAPVVVDLQKLDPQKQPIDFMALNKILRDHHLIPVGVRGTDEATQAMAQNAGFATMIDAPELAESKEKTKKTAEAEAIPASLLPERKGSRLITQPIRSGQQIYAQGGDLVVVSSVSPGAELLADGNIHVYGTLRGRALAGINGDEKARIFCQQLEAELVSIAGQYKIFEDADNQQHKGATQLHLENGQLIISSM